MVFEEYRELDVRALTRTPVDQTAANAAGVIAGNPKAGSVVVANASVTTRR